MFNSTSSFHKLLLTALLGCTALFLQATAAAGKMDNTSAQQGNIDAQEFIKKASAKNLGEIEAAQMALQKTSSQEVKQYAQHIIDDHKKANQKLKEIAQKKNIEVSEDPSLVTQAKEMALKQRDESFDTAYAENQVKGHQQAIDLFQQAANSSDSEIQQYAKQTLPKLKQHLQEAQDLVQVTKEQEGNV